MISYLDDEILVSIFTYYYFHQDSFELLFTMCSLRRLSLLFKCCGLAVDDYVFTISLLLSAAKTEIALEIQNSICLINQ